MTAEKLILERRIKLILLFYIAVLLVCGVTVFPLKTELDLLEKWIGEGTAMADIWPAMATWISTFSRGVTEASLEYPFLFYGTDWLAFAHIMIAIAFVGPLRNPVRNIWVVEFGIIACILVVPLALICGPVRGIPFFHQLIDCAFGVVGVLPLLWVRKDIRRMEVAV